jgi:hypothetical protein
MLNKFNFFSPNGSSTAVFLLLLSIESLLLYEYCNFSLDEGRG